MGKTTQNILLGFVSSIALSFIFYLMAGDVAPDFVIKTGERVTRAISETGTLPTIETVSELLENPKTTFRAYLFAGYLDLFVGLTFIVGSTLSLLSGRIGDFIVGLIIGLGAYVFSTMWFYAADFILPLVTAPAST